MKFKSSIAITLVALLLFLLPLSANATTSSKVDYSYNQTTEEVNPMPNISEIFSFVADIFVKILTPAISIAAFVLSIRNHFTDKKEKATGIDVGMYNVYEKEERGCKMLSFVLTVSNNSRYSISIYKMKFVFHGSEYEFDDERRYAYLPINLPGFLSEQKEMTLYPFDIELIDFQESVTIIAYTSRGILTLHTKPQP